MWCVVRRLTCRFCNSDLGLELRISVRSALNLAKSCRHMLTTYGNSSRILCLVVAELKNNYTIVIVTHNMYQASRVSDRTAFFLNGEIIEDDETGILFTQPAKKQTDDYISGRFG